MAWREAKLFHASEITAVLRSTPGYGWLSEAEVTKWLANKKRNGRVFEIYTDRSGGRIFWSYRHQTFNRYKVPMICHLSAKNMTWESAISICAARLKEVSHQLGISRWVTTFFPRSNLGRPDMDASVADRFKEVAKLIIVEKIIKHPRNKRNGTDNVAFVLDLNRSGLMAKASRWWRTRWV